MALPKRRKSRARVRTRRANWRAKEVTLTTCDRCDTKILPHRACDTCGHYKQRAVMPPRGEKSSAE
jgi:large subunit ribosomal protein L32